jgi:hypothetical protein
MIAESPRDYKEPKFQYSKILPIISLVLFCIVLAKTMCVDYTDYFDTAVYVSAVTVSGGIFGMIVKSYNSKAKAENVSRIQQAMYHDTMKTRLWYNEQMCKIKKEYGLTDSDIQEIEDKSPIDDISEEQVNEMKQTLDNFASDSKEEDDVQYF